MVDCSAALPTTPQLEVVFLVVVVHLLLRNQLVDCLAASVLEEGLVEGWDSLRLHNLLKTTLEALAVAVCLDSRPSKIHFNNRNQI